MRLAVPLLAALCLAQPARADDLRSPIDVALVRSIDGAGGDGPGGARIGVVPFLLSMVLAAPATALATGGGALASAGLIAATGLPPLGFAGAWITSLVVGAALHGVAAIVGGMLAKVRTNWLLAAIVGGVLSSLPVVAFVTPIGAHEIPWMLTFFGVVAVSALATPLSAFGPPAFAAWREDPVAR